MDGDAEKQPLAAPGAVHDAVQLRHLEAEKVMWVLIWMAVSTGVVIFNKWLYSTGGFPYPLALTAMHMTSCFLVFGAMRCFAPRETRVAIMPDADVEIPWSVYAKNFLMISIFYAGTLGTGNLAYLFSSVAFIQMMKPMNCIFASLASFALGMDKPTSSHIIIVCIIAFGVGTATGHDVSFSMTGCVLQFISSVSEGCRLGFVQYVTTSGLKVDPVTTVYYFSGASAVLLSCACFAREWPISLGQLQSPWWLVLNCVLAVGLNVLVAIVIKKTSAVVFTLAGIIKDMGLIVVSSAVFATPLSRMMVTGYSISIAGLCMFKAYKDNFTVFERYGFLSGMWHVADIALGFKSQPKLVYEPQK